MNNGNGRIERRLGAVETGIKKLHHRVDETNRRIDETNRRIDATNERLDATNQRLEQIDLHLSDAVKAIYALPQGIAKALNPRFMRLESDVAALQSDMTTLKKQVSAIYVAVLRGGRNGKP